jgi:hypothetical protein
LCVSEGLNYGQYLIYFKGLNWSEILTLRLAGLHEHHAVRSGFLLSAQNFLQYQGKVRKIVTESVGSRTFRMKSVCQPEVPAFIYTNFSVYGNLLYPKEGQIYLTLI